MQCPKCKADNPETQSFCGDCGTRLGQVGDAQVSFTKTLEAPVEKLTRGVLFVNRYEIIEELGIGGMGAVYRVYDTKTKEEIALKLIRPEIASDRETIDRFRNELTTARKVAHRNVCKMYDLGEEKSNNFITMEYVPGGDLKKFIRRSGQLSVEKAISIAKQICEGLGEAHSLGIIHRDLKPSNIMIDKEGNARIMDFGIARSMKEKGITGAGVMIGTPEYMSPEQAEAKEVDQRSDIYSLGLILYEMMTGKLPFCGDTPLRIAMKHNSEAPENPNEYNAQIPDDLSQLILKCLEKDKERRIPDADTLFSILSGIQIRSYPGSKAVKSKIASSIAVLPFTDLSPGKDQEYFCDGMAEELINALTQLGKLKVASRTSSFQFKGTGVDIREIGKKLEVAVVLEGSIRKAGNRVRITAQLIDITDGYHVWSEKFDRDLDDIFSIQDEIALAIVEKLKLKLLGVEKAKLTKRHTENQEAYSHYLKGRFFWNKRFEGGLLQAMDCFRQAIDMDPIFALAYVAMAECYCDIGFFGYAPPHDIYPKGKAAANKALEIDNELGEAHVSLGWIKTFYDWDWPGAEREFQKAIKLCPYYATAHSWYGWSLCVVGRFDEAVSESEKALNLDPVSLMINAIYGLVLGLNGQHDEAVEQCQKTIKMDPNFTFGHVNLGHVYGFIAARGEEKYWNSAIAELQKVAKGWSYAQGTLGMAYGISGQAKKAKEVLKHLEELSQKRFVSPAHIMFVYIGLNNWDKTFEYAEKALEIQASMLVFLKHWPTLENVRSDPRGQALLKKMGLS